MRRGFVTTLLAAFLFTTVVPAMSEAQVRVRVPAAAKPQAPKPPRVIKIKPPAVIARQVQAANPGAKVVGIKPGANGNFIVTLKQQNTVRRVIVPGG